MYFHVGSHTLRKVLLGLACTGYIEGIMPTSETFFVSRPQLSRVAEPTFARRAVL